MKTLWYHRFVQYPGMVAVSHAAILANRARGCGRMRGMLPNNAARPSSSTLQDSHHVRKSAPSIGLGADGGLKRNCEPGHRPAPTIQSCGSLAPYIPPSLWPTRHN